MFRVIPGFPNYEIDENGIVFSVKRKIIRKTIQDKDGYIKISIKKKWNFVHRLVAYTFIPNPENKPQVNHKDGNKKNNNVDNLEWVTSSENKKHSFKIGLDSHKGEKNTRSKLTTNDVDFIRSSKLKQKELAKIFCVNQSQISYIKNYKQWQ